MFVSQQLTTVQLYLKIVLTGKYKTLLISFIWVMTTQTVYTTLEILKLKPEETGQKQMSWESILYFNDKYLPNEKALHSLYFMVSGNQ